LDRDGAAVASLQRHLKFVRGKNVKSQLYNVVVIVVAVVIVGVVVVTVVVVVFDLVVVVILSSVNYIIVHVQRLSVCIRTRNEESSNEIRDINLLKDGGDSIHRVSF